MNLRKKKNLPLELLNQTEFGVCMKDTGGRVLAQNEKCIKYCGEQSGNICKKGCTEHPPFVEKKVTERKTPSLLKQRTLEDRSFDIILVPGKDHLLTILSPVESAVSVADKLQFLSKVDLTQREREVALLMVQGLSNQEICRKLFISKATVKTHINQIKKKLKISGCCFELR